MVLRSAMALACAVLVTASASSQDDAVIVMPNSADCESLSDGPGSSPDNPRDVEIEDLFGRLYDSTTSPPAPVRERPEYDCTWIRVSGHFRWVDYWHYRGRLYPNVLAPYVREQFEGTPPNSVWIESFADSSQTRAAILGANVEVVGLHYDLCWHAAETAAASLQEGVVHLNMGGPCHYGALNGLMIREARVTKSGETAQRIRGEQNRAVIGDLMAIEPSQPEFSALRSVSLDTLAPLLDGEAAYLRHLGASADIVAQSLQDQDDWPSTLVTHQGIRTLQSIDDLQALPFAAFEKAESAAAYPGHREAIGCFCLAGTCSDAWPIFEIDTDRTVAEFVCFRLRQRGTEWEPQW